MIALAVVFSALLLSGCGGGGDGGVFGDGDGDGGVAGSIPASNAAYIVVAWNDLGMHCLNPSYDTAVILPPYNTVWAQVLKRGNPPQVVTNGVTVSYRMLNNTTSQGKGLFYQFWAYAQSLFGTPPGSPTLDKGLNLDDPAISNGLSGNMIVKGTHFQVSGIPVVPYNDGSAVRNPYQVAEITVKDSTGTVVAQTQATVPTSEEINCGKCHPVGATTNPPVLGNVFNDILVQHDRIHGTNLVNQKPVLCASCHGSPALNAPLKPNPAIPGTNISYLSQAIHNSHATRGAGCYDCHPGVSTQCNRSTKHTAADGNCTNVSCHGSLSNVASSIAGGRVPWVSEPKCAAPNCHSNTIPQVDTGTTLYRNAIGHGGVYCAGCHGSPHAMVPSNQASDNYQALQYQKKAVVLGDCRVCHSSSRGGGNNFAKEHSGRISSCNICHTGFVNAANTANFPHQFQWKTR
jgi:hypothetical protein